MTLFHVTDRGEGKTEALVNWVKLGVSENGFPHWSRVIVTHNEHEAERLRKQYNLTKNQVWAWDYWVARGRGRGSNSHLQVAVDNVDIILQGLLHAYPVIVTATGEKYEGPTSA